MKEKLWEEEQGILEAKTNEELSPGYLFNYYDIYDFFLPNKINYEHISNIKSELNSKFWFVPEMKSNCCHRHILFVFIKGLCAHKLLYLAW